MFMCNWAIYDLLLHKVAILSPPTPVLHRDEQNDSYFFSVYAETW